MWFSIPCVGGYLWGQSYSRKHLQDHKIKYTFNTFSSSKSQEISEVLENSWLYIFSLEKGRAGFWKLCLSVLTPPQTPSVPYSTFSPFQMFPSPSAVLLICELQDLWDLQGKSNASMPYLSAQSTTASPYGNWMDPSLSILSAFPIKWGWDASPKNQDPPRAHTWAQDAGNAPKVPP